MRRTDSVPSFSKTTADYLQERLGWESVYAHNHEDFGPGGLLGRASDRDVVLVRPLRERVAALNPGLAGAACDEAVRQLAAPSPRGSSSPPTGRSTR